MKYISLLFAFITFSSIAEKEARLASYYIVSDEVDETLAENTSKFTFRINDHQSEIAQFIVYSINDVEKREMTSKEMSIKEIVEPGEYDFMFLLNLLHEEIIINDLEIKAQHHMVVQLNFMSAQREILMKKPIIYLYPQEETQIDILLSTTGELTFTYPYYDNGWSVTADSQGNITDGNETYNYLFWESQQQLDESIVDRNQGVIVAQKDLLSYLENSLDAFGFNSKERADFITYWIPHMKDATNLYIYFLFNEACDEFATLNISPKPTQIARFYMLWGDAGTNYDETGLLPQEIPSFNREGFTVLEWGGAEIDVKSKTID